MLQRATGPPCCSQPKLLFRFRFLFNIIFLFLLSQKDVCALRSTTNGRLRFTRQIAKQLLLQLSAQQQRGDSGPRVYKFEGSPEQLANALGVKSTKKNKRAPQRKDNQSTNGRSSNTNSNSNSYGKNYSKGNSSNKRRTDDGSPIPIDVLEQQVLSRFQSNDFQFPAEDDDFDDDDDDSSENKPLPKKRARFEGFEQFMKGNNPSKGTSSSSSGIRRSTSSSSAVVESAAADEEFPSAEEAAALRALTTTTSSSSSTISDSIDGSSGAKRSLRARLSERFKGDKLPSESTLEQAAAALTTQQQQQQQPSKWRNAAGADWDIDDLFYSTETSSTGDDDQLAFNKRSSSKNSRVNTAAGGEEDEEDWELDEQLSASDYDLDYDTSSTSRGDTAAAAVGFGPIGAVGGFRLRPPPPPDPAVVARDAARTAAAAAKEAAKIEKRRVQREEDENFFQPFTFSQPMNFDAVASEETSAAAATEATAAAAAVDETFFSAKSFEELGVTHPQILLNLQQKLRVFQPSSIQAAALPLMLLQQQQQQQQQQQLQRDLNVIMQAQTGSGKTLAYLLPLLRFVDPASKKVQALVFAPSRELVAQIGLVAAKLFADTDFRVLTLIGGANVNNQIKQLREQRPQIIIATPGRLAELVFRLQKLKLTSISAVVIDEVDNMLREPFVGEIETILDATPRFRSGGVATAAAGVDALGSVDVAAAAAEQWKSTHENTEYSQWGEEKAPSATAVNEEGASASKSVTNRLFLLASATANDAAVTAFAQRYTRSDMIFSSSNDDSSSSSGSKWQKVSVQSASMLPRGITHGLISTPRMRALQTLKKFLNAEPLAQSALIFVNDPYRVEALAQQLLDLGFIAAPLHGDTSKEDRKDILMRLRDGRLRLVVTTELAARGLDVPFLTHVINFELPTDAEHYVHRAGRCGRAGREGLVMNFANPDTKFVIRRFGKKLGVKVLDCELRAGQVYLKRK